MPTPPLPSNPSIDNPPAMPEPIRLDLQPDISDEPEEDSVNPDTAAKKMRQGETALRPENSSCLPFF